MTNTVNELSITSARIMPTRLEKSVISRHLDSGSIDDIYSRSTEGDTPLGRTEKQITLLIRIGCAAIAQQGSTAVTYNLFVVGSYLHFHGRLVLDT